MKPRVVQFTCPAVGRYSEFVTVPAETPDSEIDGLFVHWLESHTKAGWADCRAEPDRKSAAAGDRDDEE